MGDVAVHVNDGDDRASHVGNVVAHVALLVDAGLQSVAVEVAVARLRVAQHITVANDANGVMGVAIASDESQGVIDDGRAVGVHQPVLLVPSVFLPAIGCDACGGVAVHVKREVHVASAGDAVGIVVAVACVCSGLVCSLKRFYGFLFYDVAHVVEDIFIGGQVFIAMLFKSAAHGGHHLGSRLGRFSHDDV